ncbi:MAG: hypothetical protein KGO50_06730 [Myxococcales bacterium]|nr:hypothetical protein [Myxococcales bacterium]
MLVFAIVSPLAYAQSILQVPTAAPVYGELNHQDLVYDTGEYYEEHLFLGVAGSVITVDLLSEEFDPLLEIYALDAEFSAENDDIELGVNLNSQLRVILPVTGTYAIVVSSYEAGVSGRYMLSAVYDQQLQAPQQPVVQSTVVPEVAPQVAVVSRVDVEFHGALIGPCDSRGQHWDSLQSCNQPPNLSREVDGLASILSFAAPQAAIARVAANTAANAFSPPDVIGEARVRTRDGWSSGLSLGEINNNVEDSLSPDFPGNPSIRGLLADPSTVVSVNLRDEDSFNEAPIGECTFTGEELSALLQAGEQRVAMRCEEETSGRILFVDISVFASELAEPQFVGAVVP